MDSLFGLRRWGRQQHDDRSSSSSSRRTVDLSDDAPSSFAMSAPTITPVRTGSGSSAQTPRLSMDRQYGAVSPVPSAPLTPTTAVQYTHTHGLLQVAATSCLHEPSYQIPCRPKGLLDEEATMDDRPLVADKMHHGSIDKLLV